MMQLRLTTGGFSFTDPRHCSVNDPTHSTCFLDSNNHDGFYESSPIVYSQVCAIGPKVFCVCINRTDGIVSLVCSPRYC